MLFAVFSNPSTDTTYITTTFRVPACVLNDLSKHAHLHVEREIPSSKKPRLQTVKNTFGCIVPNHVAKSDPFGVAQRELNRAVMSQVVTRGPGRCGLARTSHSTKSQVIYIFEGSKSKWNHSSAKTSIAQGDMPPCLVCPERCCQFLNSARRNDSIDTPGCCILLT
jgi:hypothetical protein